MHDVYAKRFSDKEYPAQQIVRSGLGQARRNDDRDVGIGACDLASEGEAIVHARHLHIVEQQRDTRIMFLKHEQRLFARGGF